MGHPTIFPTGVTIYNKEKASNGYTVFPSAKGALLIDMNGNEVNLWAGLAGFPNKILPGGYVIGSSGVRSGKKAYQDYLDLIQVDWEGRIVWQFNQNEWIEDEGETPAYQARQHHDYQREGSPVGYYAPGLIPQTDSGKTLILTHENVRNEKISDHLLLDDKIIEVDWDGNLLWSWRASDHFDELGFDEAAKQALFNHPGLKDEAGGDWMHINSVSTLGPNKWYDAGDERFHPDNIIFDARNTNILGIISKATGAIVYRIGPDYRSSQALQKLGWIIGQHHFHLIPQGLPGAGDFLVFDNGGQGGYGTPNPASADGTNNAVRDYSRVLQINPLTLEITWQYTPEEAGYTLFTDGYRFYSPYISAAQRLENGNTLITEGSDGRIFEVTPEHEIVWEYINPYYRSIGDKFSLNMVYRAYRVPYEWVPQAERHEEISIAPVDVTKFRLPGASLGEGTGKVTEVTGVNPNNTTITGMSDEDRQSGKADFCLVTFDTEKKEHENEK